jgi:hypothetical protein
MSPQNQKSNNKNDTRNFEQSQEQTPVVPIESAEVMHYIDTWGLVGVMLIIILEMATPIGMLFPTDAIVFG